MKAWIDGEAAELADEGVEVVRLPDRWMLRTPEGAFTAVAVRQGDATLISYKGRQFRVETRPPRRTAASASAGGELRAPMPGQIVDVRVAPGQAVRKGETLVVLEAMKTQQPFAAPFDGTVARLGVAKGDQVSEGTVLAVVEP